MSTYSTHLYNPQSILEKIKGKFTVDPVTECWLWHTNQLYMRHNGTQTRVTRHISNEVNGPGRIFHTCSNEYCVNPQHIKLYNSPAHEEYRIQLFWRNVDIREVEECWKWQANINVKGYGKWVYMGKDVLAHRAAYEFFYKIKPKELQVCHRCDNPACCNPHHLWLGTAKENCDDMYAKGRNNNPRGSKHGNVKLTQEHVDTMRRLHAMGLPMPHIANLFSQVQYQQVVKILKKEAWN